MGTNCYTAKKINIKQIRLDSDLEEATHHRFDRH